MSVVARTSNSSRRFPCSQRLLFVFLALLLGSFSGTTTALENNLHFAGHYYDKESGLYYNGQRYYNPRTGRYLTPDPLGLVAGPNLYRYARGNPIRYFDPTGLLDWEGSQMMFMAAKGFGGAQSLFNLKSECKCGRQVEAKVYGSGIVRGLGVAVSLSRVRLEDPNSCPAATNLEGLWEQVMVGVTAGAGVGLSLGFGQIQLGDAYGLPSLGGGVDAPVTGISVGGTVIFGSATVLDSSESFCCE